jgi:CRISPR/Cas system-associated exonuclease Cas4 (RecB family)
MENDKEKIEKALKEIDKLLENRWIPTKNGGFLFQR